MSGVSGDSCEHLHNAESRCIPALSHKQLQGKGEQESFAKSHCHSGHIQLHTRKGQQMRTGMEREMKHWHVDRTMFHTKVGTLWSSLDTNFSPMPSKHAEFWSLGFFFRHTFLLLLFRYSKVEQMNKYFFLKFWLLSNFLSRRLSTMKRQVQPRATALLSGTGGTGHT